MHYPLLNAGIPDTSNLTLSATINSFIVDRLSGVTITERVYGEEMNVTYIVRRIRNDVVRTEVANFFTTRRIGSIFSSLIATNTIRVGGYYFNVSDLVRDVSESVGSRDAAAAIVEILCPVLYGTGLMTRSSAIMARHTYDFNAMAGVFTDIAADIITQELTRAVRASAALFNVEPGRVYSTKQVGIELAEAFFAVGTALRNTADFSAVLEAMVWGVRAKIDPNLSGLKGSVPSDIVNHVVVDTLSTNLNFIQEALLLAEAASMNPIDGWKFDKWAPVILSMIRLSERYSIVNRSELINQFSIRKTYGLDGIVRFAVINQKASVEAAALALIAIDDVAFDGAWALDTTNERVAEHVAAAYGDFAHKFTTEMGAAHVSEVARDLIEHDAEALSGVEVFSVDFRSPEDLAMMLCDRIMFKPGSWSDRIYTMATAERTMHLESGVVMSGFIYTRDPVEILLASAEREATAAVLPRPQLLPREALHARLLRSDGDNLTFISIRDRFAFGVQIFDLPLRGSLRASDLASMSSSNQLSLVIPAYNRWVVSVVMEQLGTARVMCESGPAELRRRLKRSHAALVLKDIAQSLSPGFRSEVHRAMIDRTIGRMDPGQATLMRARLSQTAVGAFVDLASVAFFLRLQGLTEHASVGKPEAADAAVGRLVDSGATDSDATLRFSAEGLITPLLADPDYVEEWSALGSDRKGARI